MLQKQRNNCVVCTMLVLMLVLLPFLSFFSSLHRLMIIDIEKKEVSCHLSEFQCNQNWRNWYQLLKYSMMYIVHCTYKTLLNGQAMRFCLSNIQFQLNKSWNERWWLYTVESLSHSLHNKNKIKNVTVSQWMRKFPIIIRSDFFPLQIRHRVVLVYLWVFDDVCQ